MGCNKAALREVYAIQAYLRKHKKISSKQTNITPKRTRERRTNKAQS